MRGLLLGGGASVALGVGLARTSDGSIWLPSVGYCLIVVGSIPLFFGGLMALYAVAGKYRVRDALLNMVDWRGAEQVLDVGTGAGLLLVGAAKRLTTGRAVGIDIWATKDLSNNARDATLRNIDIEQVGDTATVADGNATQLAFADETFDVVVSLLCLHNIEPKIARDRACAEIARVLKKGGRVVIGDYLPTHAYANVFEREGLRVLANGTRFATALSLMWFVIAERPE